MFSEIDRKRPSPDWANDSMDDIMLNVPRPKRFHTDELDPEEDKLFIGMDIFGGNQPPHMNFKDFVKLKLVREKDIRKFQIKQQFYDVEIEKLPFTLSNGLSMQVLLNSSPQFSISALTPSALTIESVSTSRVVIWTPTSTFKSPGYQ